MKEHCEKKEAVSVGLLGNAADVLPEIARRTKAGGIRPDLVTDQTSAHDLVNGYLPIGWTLARWRSAQSNPADHEALKTAAGRSCAVHVRAMLEFKAMGIPVVDYGNNIRQVAKDHGVADAFAFPGFVPAYIRPLFCEGKGAVPLGGAVGRARRHPPDPTPVSSSCSPATPACAAGSTWPAPASASRGCRRGSAGWALANATWPAWRFNEMVRTGELKAPIVIGRDHLDTGSVASRIARPSQ